jgi:hypothetical protein
MFAFMPLIPVCFQVTAPGCPPGKTEKVTGAQAAKIVNQINRQIGTGLRKQEHIEVDI